MFSTHPSREDVLEGLGDKVVGGLALMVAQAREDLRVYRSTFPGWVAESTDRGLLNWCHDRLWTHALRIFDELQGITMVDKPPVREIFVGTSYRLRVKKHDFDGRVSTYLTQGALEFLEQEPTLPGMEEVRLIAGYRWDPDTRDIGSAVISLRDGPTSLIWMHDLDDPADGAVLTTVPIVSPTGPRRPEIGLVSDRERHGGAQEER